MTAIIGGILLAAGVVLFILEPMMSGQRALLYGGDDDYDEAASRRRIALTALRDLEYDRVTGKVDEIGYERLKAELSREALVHLRQAKEREASGTEAHQHVAASEALEEEIARIRRALEQGLQCQACGQVNLEGAQFCGACGNPLPVGQDAEVGH